MIWIEFWRGTPDAVKSIVFLGEGEDIQIRVLTDPQVEGLSLSGIAQLPSGTVVDLTFQDGHVAFFTPGEDGTYRVKVTAEKEGYRPSRLSATFHYRK
jgi:hypothetical protein